MMTRNSNVSVQSENSGSRNLSKNASSIRKIAIAAGVGSILVLSGCNTEKVLTHGTTLTETDIQLVPVGSSKDQVLLALGTPSTTGTFDNEVFYYISQKRKKDFAFQKGTIVDQRIVAIYFDEASTVERVADYGIQDGVVFDFISRTTPTGGRDMTLLERFFSGSGTSKRPNTGPAEPPKPIGKL